MKRITLFSLLMLFVHCVTATTTPAQTSEKDSAGVQREVREVFDKWSTALGRADKKAYLDTFWNSPRLVIRVANGEWRGGSKPIASASRRLSFRPRAVGRQERRGGGCWRGDASLPVGLRAAGSRWGNRSSG